MKAKVTLSTNAGVMIEYNNIKIMSDFLHHFDVPTFSAVPEKLCDEILNDKKYANAELFLISHDHPDHFSLPLDSEYLRRNKSTTAVAPFHFAEREFVMNGTSGKLKTFNANVEFFKTPHEKQKVYADSKHYAYSVTVDGKRFAFLNDSAAEEEYLDKIFEQRAQIAFINFPWLTLKNARLMLEKKINADNAVFYHLPIPAEDEYGFNDAVKKALVKFDPGETRICVMSTPGDHEEFELD